MQSCIKHPLKHFALVLKAKLNQLKPFVRFVLHSSILLHLYIRHIIKYLHTQTFFIPLYDSFSCPYRYTDPPLRSFPAWGVSVWESARIRCGILPFRDVAESPCRDASKCRCVWGRRDSVFSPESGFDACVCGFAASVLSRGERRTAGKQERRPR